MNRDEDPPFFKIKSERMAYHDICDGNLFLLDPFVVFGFRFGTDLN